MEVDTFADKNEATPALRIEIRVEDPVQPTSAGSFSFPLTCRNEGWLRRWTYPNGGDFYITVREWK